MDRDTLKAALGAVGVAELVAVSNPAWRPTADNAFEGSLVIAGSSCRFGFCLADEFPGALPKVYALSPELLRLPHVDGQGFVCAFEDENTLHDYRAADGLVQETVERARSVVEDGLLGRNRDDFWEEFEAYWPRGVDVASAITPGNEPITIKASFDGRQLLAVADSELALSTMFPRARGQVRNGLYLPLKRVSLDTSHPLDLCTWDALVPLLSDDSQRHAQATRVARKQHIPVLIGFERPNGERALVGLLLRKFTCDSTLFASHPVETQPFTTTRCDETRVRRRLTGPRSASRIVVVGCGSVGGHLAHTLAWTGARELVLVDPDIGGPGNTFRHVLGRRLWGHPKVEALKQELERCLPGLGVTAIPKSARAALLEEPDLMRSADVVIVAIGNHSVPLQLNDMFAVEKVATPVVFTWLEPYGIGGHAVLVNYREPGCLRCLFEEQPTLSCTVEFSAPGQRFGRRDAGCQALYTPYADIDARATALLAARLVGRATLAGKPSGWRGSWRGDAGAFVEAGFRLSPRYEEHVRDAPVPLQPRLGCPTCAQ